MEKLSNIFSVLQLGADDDQLHTPDSSSTTDKKEKKGNSSSNLVPSKNEKNCEQDSMIPSEQYRYIIVVKVSDASGEAWLSLFKEQAERIFGCSVDELDKLKSQEGEENLFQQQLKEAIWVPHLFRISVAQHEYMNEKRQRITARAVVPVDFAAESRLLLEEISKMNFWHSKSDVLKTLFYLQEGEENLFQQQLKEAIWVPHLFLVSVAQHEYMNEKRQRITARAVVPVDFAAESRLLLEEISKMKTSQ